MAHTTQSKPCWFCDKPTTHRVDGADAQKLGLGEAEQVCCKPCLRDVRAQQEYIGSPTGYVYMNSFF